ncbi:MAG: hypothetical protein IPK10_17470 [Bacteroidetes bacterium]|nr:hypothetical protein [Bacteroidota bacterium]
MSRLAEKKLLNISGINQQSKFENAVQNLLIYQGLNLNGGFVLSNSEDIWKIAYRSWYYGATIIGLESNIDEDVPFYDFCIEDYVTTEANFEYDNNTFWILAPLMPVVTKYPNIQLKFYFDIPVTHITESEQTSGSL